MTSSALPEMTRMDSVDSLGHPDLVDSTIYSLPSLEEAVVLADRQEAVVDHRKAMTVSCA